MSSPSVSAVTIGKLVKSNSQTDYVCQIYGRGEVEVPPEPHHYAFGTFVRIPLQDRGGDLAGVIYDTVLHNPEFGNLGPRLSPASDLEVFSPDYLTEKVTLVGITVVGMLTADAEPRQGVPPLSAPVDTLVMRMGDEAVRRFHQREDGGVRLGYAPLLLGQGSPLARHLLLSIVQRLGDLLPGEVERLAVLHHEWAWQASIGPMGGGS